MPRRGQGSPSIAAMRNGGLDKLNIVADKPPTAFVQTVCFDLSCGTGATAAEHVAEFCIPLRWRACCGERNTTDRPSVWSGLLVLPYRRYNRG